MTDKEKIEEIIYKYNSQNDGETMVLHQVEFSGVIERIETLLKEREKESYEKGFNDSSDEMIDWLKNKQGIRVPTK